MKRLLPLLILLPSAVFGQAYKQQYVTQGSDTLRPGMHLSIAAGKPAAYIYPHPDRPLDPMRMDAARRYLLTTMSGKAYKIARLTRIPAGKGQYKAIAVIQVNTPEIQRLSNIDYFIEIEGALRNAEVAVVQ